MHKSYMFVREKNNNIGNMEVYEEKGWASKRINEMRLKDDDEWKMNEK